MEDEEDSPDPPAHQGKIPLRRPELCFLNRRGQPIDQSRLTKRLKRSLKRAALPTAHGLYDLRHTYATIALSEGRPPTYVAEQIGDSVETLHRWYAHWFPRRRRVMMSPIPSKTVDQPASDQRERL